MKKIINVIFKNYMMQINFNLIHNVFPSPLFHFYTSNTTVLKNVALHQETWRGGGGLLAELVDVAVGLYIPETLSM